MSRVLVISPHPDDESLGCGGTLRRHALDGDRVHVVFLTSGEKGGHGRPPEETRRIREAEARRAARLLGVEAIEFWREPDGALRAHPNVVRRLREKLHHERPSVIYVPHEHDAHPDHRAAVRILRAALRDSRRSGSACIVRMFEVWTPIRRIDEIVDISDVVKRKLAAIRAYRSQCGVLAFDQAMLSLARYRGEMHSWPGGDYAEVFAAMRR